MKITNVFFAPLNILYFPSPAAKADKRAAQVKVQQQESKRQVCISL